MNWPDTQRAFATAVRDPDQSVPDAVGPRQHGVPVSRFNVYRNNTAVSLTEAVGDTFPVVAELVGDEFFTAMARGYVTANVPASPVLIHYGHSFPDFIESFEPAQSLPFLPDVARVEWAWSQSYHAADRDSINAEHLQRIDPERLAEHRLELHPSTYLLKSQWPVVSVWSAHQIESPDERAEALARIEQVPEYALIVRPEFEVNVQLIAQPVWQLLDAFEQGASLGEAAGTLGEADVAEFGGMLGYIFSTGVVTAVLPNKQERSKHSDGSEGEET